MASPTGGSQHIQQHFSFLSANCPGPCVHSTTSRSVQERSTLRHRHPFPRWKRPTEGVKELILPHMGKCQRKQARLGVTPQVAPLTIKNLEQRLRRVALASSESEVVAVSSLISPSRTTMAPTHPSLPYRPCRERPWKTAKPVRSLQITSPAHLAQPTTNPVLHIRWTNQVMEALALLMPISFYLSHASFSESL